MAQGVDEIVRLRAAEDEALTQVTEARECACSGASGTRQRGTAAAAQTAS